MSLVHQKYAPVRRAYLTHRLFVDGDLIPERLLYHFIHVGRDYMDRDRVNCGMCYWLQHPFENGKKFQCCLELGRNEMNAPCGDYATNGGPAIVKTFKVHRNGLISFERGNIDKLLYLFKKYDLPKFEIQDLRGDSKLGVELEFDESKVSKDPRWPEQKKAVLEWLAAGGGVIQAETGSGKSVMLCYALSVLNLKTIIFDNEATRLKQLEDHMRNLLDINSVEKITGQRIIGRYPTDSTKFFPITLATYQTFYYRDRHSYLKNSNYFGLQWCEEDHTIPALTYSKIAGMVNAKVRGGSSATQRRKDGLEKVIFDIIGPVVAKPRIESLRGTVTIINTSVWSRVVQKWIWHKYLAKQDARTALIAKWIARDHKDGRRIIAYSEKIDLCFALQKRLEDKYDLKAFVVTGQTPPTMRKKIYEAMNTYVNKRILIATDVIKLGINIPRADTLHMCLPNANEITTNQVVGRIVRVDPDKKAPLVRDYLDLGTLALPYYKTREKAYLEKGFQIIKNTPDEPKGRWK